MSTRSKWKNSILHWFDPSLGYETINAMMPVQLYDDFLVRPDNYTAADNSAGKWTSKITGAAPPTIATVADGPNGVVRLHMTADDQKQEAGLHFGDERPLVLNQGLIFEARCCLHVLPTLLSEIYIGLAGDYVEGTLAADGPAEHMLFVADGSGAIIIHTDDTANDNSGIATGVTLLADQYAIFKIDCSIITDVRFFINGLAVATGTTFDMSTTAALALQPYFMCHKESGAGVGDLDIDYVKIWQKRS